MTCPHWMNAEVLITIGGITVTHVRVEQTQHQITNSVRDQHTGSVDSGHKATVMEQVDQHVLNGDTKS